MDITTFDDLLLAARQQPDPQRLLLVFAGASLPPDASAAQRAEFEAKQQGGELAPLMCVDKDPLALASFAALAAEAKTLGPPWMLVFAGALAGQAPLPPSESQVEAALEQMVEAVRVGDLVPYLAFDREGHAVTLV